MVNNVVHRDAIAINVIVINLSFRSVASENVILSVTAFFLCPVFENTALAIIIDDVIFDGIAFGEVFIGNIIFAVIDERKRLVRRRSHFFKNSLHL